MPPSCRSHAPHAPRGEPLHRARAIPNPGRRAARHATENAHVRPHELADESDTAGQHEVTPEHNVRRPLTRPPLKERIREHPERHRRPRRRFSTGTLSPKRVRRQVGLVDQLTYGYQARTRLGQSLGRGESNRRAKPAGTTSFAILSSSAPAGAAIRWRFLRLLASSPGSSAGRAASTAHGRLDRWDHQVPRVEPRTPARTGQHARVDVGPGFRTCSCGTSEPGRLSGQSKPQRARSCTVSAPH